MLRHRLALLVVLTSPSCTHDLSSVFGPEAGLRDARALLAEAKFEAAHEAYQRVLVGYPNNPDALFGAVFTDLALIGTWPGLRDLTEHCNQPQLDLAGLLFGDDGVLAQAVLVREGTTDLTIHRFAGPGAAASQVVFAPNDVRAGVREPDEADPRRTLTLTVRERDVDSPVWFSLSINVDDLRGGDEAITPLVAGMEVPLTELAGDLEVIDFASTDMGYRARGGVVRVLQAGRSADDPIELELVDASVWAYPNGGCSGDCEQGWYTINGRITDVISRPLELDRTKQPFADLMGAPELSDEVLAIDSCRSLDDRYIAAQARKVGDRLATNAAALQALVDASAPFRFDVPGRLIRAPADLPVNRADARTLQGFLLLGASLLEIGGQYRWLAGDLQAQIEEHDWYLDGHEFPQPVRVLWPATLAMNLELGFLTKPEGFDLATGRERLRGALGALRRATQDVPDRPGLLDFSAPASARLVGELAGVVGALEQSIDSGAPVPLPAAPLFRVHLGSFFDDPLDAARIRQLTGLLRLWSVLAPDLAAGRRNPELTLELSLSDLEVASDGVLLSPPSPAPETCMGGTGCPSGYVCEEPACELAQPWFTTEDAWEMSSRSGWPAFVSRALRDALAIDL